MIGGDHEFSDTSRPVLEQARKSAGITVGAGAWLGAGAKILDGVQIGANAIVGAGRRRPRLRAGKICRGRYSRANSGYA